MTFSNAKEKKFKLCKVGVGSNIAQNHSSSLQGVISGHHLPKCTWKVDQKWNYVQVGFDSKIAQNHSSNPYKVMSAHYLPQFTKSEIGQIGLGLNIDHNYALLYGLDIAQNHSSSPYKVISGYYLLKFIWEVYQKWN